jgi:bacteriocin-like protein
MIERKIAGSCVRELTDAELAAVSGGEEGQYTFTECDSEPRQIGDWIIILVDIIDD